MMMMMMMLMKRKKSNIKENHIINELIKSQESI